MSARFAGEKVLVAGGTGGLGHAVSLAFLAEEATVIATYRHEEEFNALRSAAGEHASRLQGHSVDVTDAAAVSQFVQTLVKSQGRLDALVNTVGGYFGGAALWEFDTRAFDQMLALNLCSGYNLSRAVVPVMLQQGTGAIVNVASRAAVEHTGGSAAYAASKAAAVAMIDVLAADVMGTGVRVNSILPSIIDTPANRRAMPTADFNTWPKPEQIARVVLFLCSKDADVIHGAAIPVYGNGASV